MDRRRRGFVSVAEERITSPSIVPVTSTLNTSSIGLIVYAWQLESPSFHVCRFIHANLTNVQAAQRRSEVGRATYSYAGKRTGQRGEKDLFQGKVEENCPGISQIRKPGVVKE